jgi:gluconolactonase
MRFFPAHFKGFWGQRHTIPRDFLAGAKVEKLASGFRFVEGPIWIAEENCLLFSDIPANRIYRLDAKRRTTIFREPSDNSNGLTRDARGRLLICQHKARRVGALDRDGKFQVLADQFQKRKLNSPNDIVVKSDGAIYFTDPFSGTNASFREQTVDGVYRLTPSGVLTLLTDDFARPNGLTFSPDESRLYIGDSSPRSHIRVFDVQTDGALSNGRIFYKLPGATQKGASPDGIKVDAAGHVFCAARGGVWVFDVSGNHLGIIRIPEQPSNCNWGDEDGRSLYVTAQTSIYRVRLKTGGAPVASRVG